MTRDPAIEITSLWKLFQIKRQGGTRRPELQTDQVPIHDPNERAVSEGNAFWALRDINLTIGHGDVVGLIGANGAGKSTLLKILSQVVSPTRGQARIRGSIASLLELGAGFHDELTGRENIALNATILGMSKAEIERRFDDIVVFSGIGDFIDMPAKYLSSGMRVRLGFAVAVHVDPEILVIDEVLAVGDAEFQERCRKRITEIIKNENRTVLIASHNMASIRSLCSRVIHLEQGSIVADGPPEETVENYLTPLPRSSPQIKSSGDEQLVKAVVLNLPERFRPKMDETNSWCLRQRTDRKGDGRLQFTAMSLRDRNGHQVRSIGAGQRVTFALDYVASEEILGWRTCYTNVGIINDRGHRLCVVPSHLVGLRAMMIQRQGTMYCKVEDLPLMPGTYSIDLVCKIEGTLADKLRMAALMDIDPTDFYLTGQFPEEGIANVILRYDWSDNSLGSGSHYERIPASSAENKPKSGW